MLANIKSKAQGHIDKLTKKNVKDPLKDGEYVEMNEDKLPEEVKVNDKEKPLKSQQDQESFVDKKPTAMDHILKGYNAMATKVNQLKSNYNDAYVVLDANIRTGIINKKKALNLWIAVYNLLNGKNKADERIMKTMSKMQPKITKSVQDNKMPECMKNFTADIVNKLWTDLTDLLRFELRVSMQKPQIELSRQPDQYRILCLWYKLRNWYLYSVFPYDKSIWEQIKDPSYLFWKSFQAITYYGIQTIAFFLLFLAIDKTEEFQLINFILNYKTVQFITAGCFNAVYGYFSYFYCATILPIQQAKQDFLNKGSRILGQEQQDNPYQVLNLNQCFQSGPGSGMDISISLILFFVQVLLIWISFFCLFRSKGRVDFIETELKVNKGIRGGRLIYFMIYDLISFLASVTMTMLIYLEYYYIPGQTFKLYQEVDGLFYFAKLVYGTLSFPFLIFAVDYLVQVFTTAKPTAYDQYGNVVPVTNKIKLVYSEIPQDTEEEIDIEEALDNKVKPIDGKITVS